MEKASVYENIVNLSNDSVTLDRSRLQLPGSERLVLPRGAETTGANHRADGFAGLGGREVRSPIKGFLDRCFAGEEVNNIDKFKFGPFMKYMHVTYFPYREDGGVVACPGFLP